MNGTVSYQNSYTHILNMKLVQIAMELTTGVSLPD